MTGVLRDSKHRLMKSPRHQPYRVFDYQHVPSAAGDFASLRRCSSFSSSSKSLWSSKERAQSRHSTRSTRSQLCLEELVCIRKELTVIKSQIDELLESLERMESQEQQTCEDGVVYSPALHGSVNSVDSSGSSSPSRTDREPQRTHTEEEDRPDVNEDESDLFYM
ncbi:uncharacterized protein si:dkey-234i14.2 isoform X1 [Danio rerio]|uniref:Uncharacterized protein si:dkey-234i14.2 isoform X1 n=1 Tax=Danio rerio TaxID=7955 RepID=A0A8M2BAE5_DANRE|nr:RNA-binding Raly-like protein [Danio rerio]|eukprot:XP_005163273.1 RNA-binding Raly-like protein [Danio rerio]